MFRSKGSRFVAVALLCAMALGAAAQEAGPPAGSAPQRNAQAPAATTSARLRVQLLISRFQDEKKVSSLPYSFIVAPNSNMTSIRLGVDMPNTASSGPVGNETNNVQYRNIGTNIDCSNVRELPGERYQFDIRAQSITVVPASDTGASSVRPLFRRFEANFTVQLRDGQSMQTIASTDPVSGEVVKIEVTINVVR